MLARSIEFSAETRISGIEFIASKKVLQLNKEEEEEFREIARTVVDGEATDTIDSLEEDIDRASKSKVHDMLLDLERQSSNLAEGQAAGENS